MRSITTRVEERDPTIEELRARERAQERAARDAADDAESAEEARLNLRRAEKAGYLEEKLAEQARADRQGDGDEGEGDAGGRAER